MARGLATYEHDEFAAELGEVRFSPSELDEEVNLAPFVDPSPPVVFPTTALAHVFGQNKANRSLGWGGTWRGDERDERSGPK